jgi:hypothetical protein
MLFIGANPQTGDSLQRAVGAQFRFNPLFIGANPQTVYSLSFTPDQAVAFQSPFHRGQSSDRTTHIHTAVATLFQSPFHRGQSSDLYRTALRQRTPIVSIP